MLSNEMIGELFAHAQNAHPYEACGLIFHKAGMIGCWNAAEDATRSFHITITEYQGLCKHTGETPWAIFHSHPGKGAAPSPTDCKLMDAIQVAKMDLAMIIVGMNPSEVRCFKKQGDLYHLQWHWKPNSLDPDVPIYCAVSV